MPLPTQTKILKAMVLYWLLPGTSLFSQQVQTSSAVQCACVRCVRGVKMEENTVKIFQQDRHLKHLDAEAV